MTLRTGNNCVVHYASCIMSQSVRCKTRQGFTFIELMITVTVLSIVLVFILHAFSISIKASGLSQDITKACLLAESKISELELKQDKGLEIPLQDHSELDKLGWSYEITPLEDSGLSILKFKVSGNRPKKEEILEIVTYLKTR